VLQGIGRAIRVDETLGAAVAGGAYDVGSRALRPECALTQRRVVVLQCRLFMFVAHSASVLQVGMHALLTQAVFGLVAVQ